jgi:hypothetical protein
LPPLLLGSRDKHFNPRHFEFWSGFGTRVPPKKKGAGVESLHRRRKLEKQKKSKAEDEGAAGHNWLIEALRRGRHTVFDSAAVADRAVALGLYTAVVMIAPKSEGSGPQTKTATKKQAKDADASSKKSAIAASAASLVS